MQVQDVINLGKEEIGGDRFGLTEATKVWRRVVNNLEKCLADSNESAIATVEQCEVLADKLLKVIIANDVDEPRGKSFIASSIYELAVAYGAKKHDLREAEDTIKKALKALNDGDVGMAVIELEGM